MLPLYRYVWENASREPKNLFAILCSHFAALQSTAGLGFVFRSVAVPLQCLDAMMDTSWTSGLSPKLISWIARVSISVGNLSLNHVLGVSSLCGHKVVSQQFGRSKDPLTADVADL